MTLPGYQVCEHLPRLAQHIDRFTLIRGISHAAGAHPQANEYLYTGNRPTPTVVHPSLGSVFSKELEAPAAIPPFVAVPNSDKGRAISASRTGRSSRRRSPKRARRSMSVAWP